MSRTYLFTSEFVFDGHPDKLADRISDAVLDHCLALEPCARVACETLLTRELVVVAGELGLSSSELHPQVLDDVVGIVREVLRETGYRADFPGIDPDSCEVQVRLHHQSSQIAGGVLRGEDELGAGDQGMMFGYASDETSELMPLPIQLAHRLMQRHRELRDSGTLPWLRPDAKAQVTVRYHDEEPVAVETVVLSTQHDEAVSTSTVEQAVIHELIEPVVPQALRSEAIRYLVNPAGRFEIGGPLGDAGLTGRKIIVDTYGGRCPNGGGAFSGKDATKVDRSGAYSARWVAKHLVAAGLARRATIQLAYAIGRPDPVSLLVDTHSTGKVPDETLEEAVRETFDLSVAGILRDLDLQHPLYAVTAAFGHVGREDVALPWEETPRLRQLQQAAALGRRPPTDQQRLTRFMLEAYDFADKTWRHLNFFQHHCYLHARVPRTKCPEHGVKRIEVPWARSGSDFTLLFEQAAMSLVKEMPVLAVSRQLEISYKRLWRIVHHYVRRMLGKLDLSKVEAVGLDETASRRGHRYVTVFLDMQRRQEPMIFAIPGHGKAAIEAFSAFLAEQGGDPDNVVEVVCDMSQAFLSGVAENLPNAEVTVDWFHIVQTFTKALDEVRKKERREKGHPQALRWAVLKRADNNKLTATQLAALQELVADRGATADAWVIKEKLRWIQKAPTPRAARWQITNYLNVMREAVTNQPLFKPMEGMNGLFQAARSRARGYRNETNFIAMIYLIGSPVGRLLDQAKST